MTDELRVLAARQALLATLPPVDDRVAVRRALGVTVTDLARLVGCSRAWIDKFERGETVPTGERLVDLSKFYDVAEGRYVDA
jgi:transcriptional regulator with XRE-family HTH domain